MKQFHILILVLSALFAGLPAAAQNTSGGGVTKVSTVPGTSDDVLIPISKYIASGNAEALSAWFADNLEIAILSRESDASRAQAKQIVKSFFDNHTPRNFNIDHTSGRAGMKYALGTLKAGGETFTVTIFLSCKDSTYKIQHLKIERF
ncbi:MAG: DUF4783 domain-containing protein [Bacteroidales bacterium]|nr:DUF4783 domain-containing protein [Bacteroidales bacterium]